MTREQTKRWKKLENRMIDNFGKFCQHLGGKIISSYDGTFKYRKCSFKKDRVFTHITLDAGNNNVEFMEDIDTWDRLMREDYRHRMHIARTVELVVQPEVKLDIYNKQKINDYYISNKGGVIKGKLKVSAITAKIANTGRTVLTLED